MLKAILLIGAATICAAASPPSERNAASLKVERVIARSKTAETTYAVYSWNKISLPGRPPVEEWSAEFNAGHKHRVETPRDRVVADCAAITGSAMLLATGKASKGPDIARSACGISTTAAITDMQYLDRVETPWGMADRVRVTDAEHIRTYDVSDDGIILHAVYQDRTAGQPVILETDAYRLERSLPAADMFSDASLASSFVPDADRAMPILDYPLSSVLDSAVAFCAATVPPPSWTKAPPPPGSWTAHYVQNLEDIAAPLAIRITTYRRVVAGRLLAAVMSEIAPESADGRTMCEVFDPLVEFKVSASAFAAWAGRPSNHQPFRDNPGDVMIGWQPGLSANARISQVTFVSPRFNPVTAELRGGLAYAAEIRSPPDSEPK